MVNEEDDLFEEEFDFVDDDDSEVEESEVEESSTEEDAEEKEPSKPRRRSAKASDSKGGAKQDAKKQDTKKTASAEDNGGGKADTKAEAEPEKAAEPPGPPADHVVHVYEHGDFKRTIQREFTDEDSIKFAEEYNRTSKSYGRRAVPDHRDEKPDPHL